MIAATVSPEPHDRRPLILSFEPATGACFNPSAFQIIMRRVYIIERMVEVKSNLSQAAEQSRKGLTFYDHIKYQQALWRKSGNARNAFLLMLREYGEERLLSEAEYGHLGYYERFSEPSACCETRLQSGS